MNISQALRMFVLNISMSQLHQELLNSCTKIFIKSFKLRVATISNNKQQKIIRTLEHCLPCTSRDTWISNARLDTGSIRPIYECSDFKRTFQKFIGNISFLLKCIQAALLHILLKKGTAWDCCRNMETWFDSLKTWSMKHLFQNVSTSISPLSYQQTPQCVA